MTANIGEHKGRIDIRWQHGKQEHDQRGSGQAAQAWNQQPGHPTHYRLMFTRTLAGHQAYPGLGNASRVLFLGLRQAIKAGQAARVIRSGDPRVLTKITWALVHGQASLLIEGQLAKPLDSNALARLATETLINGLRS